MKIILINLLCFNFSAKKPHCFNYEQIMLNTALIVNERSSNFKNRPNLSIGELKASVRPKHRPILFLGNLLYQISYTLKNFDLITEKKIEVEGWLLG